MSTDTTTDERTITELRRMDDATAKRELSYAEYQRWASINDHLDRYDEAKQRWDETRAEATQTLVTADPADFAAEVSVWGNDLAVYYASDDPRLRETVESLADVFDIDVDAAAEGDLEAIEADDVAEEDIATAKDTLADLVLLATVTWDGERVSEFDRDRRAAYREAIAADPPEGWGLAGLMDAWGEIQYAVEKSRDDRLERVQKFRDARRRGDR